MHYATVLLFFGCEALIVCVLLSCRAKKGEKQPFDDPILADERLANCDPQHVENILNEIMDSKTKVCAPLLRQCLFE